MYARCPHCRTVFNVDQAQLQAAKGLVRCGNCFEPFDARAAALDRLHERPVPPRRAAQRRGEPTEEVAREAVKWREAEVAGSAARDLPEVLRQDAEAERRRLGGTGALVYGIIVLALIGLLTAQLVAYYPERFARTFPALRPYSEALQVWRVRLFAALGHPPPPFHDPSRIRLISRSVGPHPAVDDALRVTGTLRNEAASPQAYPWVRLKLFDVNGGRIAERVFSPDEYLRGFAHGNASFGAGDTVQFTLDLNSPVTAAVSYEFEFH